MQVIALPGRNEQTEAWLRSVLAESGLPSDGIVRYRHWDGAVDADAEFEARRLSGLSPALVIAKSFGTVVTARALCSHHFRPQSAILIGTPFGAVDPSDLASLQHLAEGVETLFIQQAEEPGGPASALQASLRALQATVAAMAGNDHLYKEVGALATIIQSWMRRAS